MRAKYPCWIRPRRAWRTPVNGRPKPVEIRIAVDDQEVRCVDAHVADDVFCQALVQRQAKDERIRERIRDLVRVEQRRNL
jgi:hypothetical protein